MGSVNAETVSCAGFPPDTYDRYVLGLLDAQERANVDRQVEQHCPVCIGGVQRSMNLWLVFANSLEQTEPAADFRARLVRIAELSNRVLTVQKRHKRVREPGILISSLVVICLILVTLLISMWIAGSESARLDAQRATAALERQSHEATDNQVQLQQQVEQYRAAAAKLSDPSRFAAQKKMEDNLSRAQAEAQQYKAILERESQQTTDNSLLVSALGSPGAKLLTFRNGEGTSSTAYAFIIENSKVIFVASNLAPPAGEHQYQLWLVRKTQKSPAAVACPSCANSPAGDPHFVSAGVFSPADDKPVVITYTEDKEVIANLAGLVVTEEPVSGSSTPTGAKVLETPGASGSSDDERD